jgi:hypothetical protein
MAAAIALRYGRITEPGVIQRLHAKNRSAFLANVPLLLEVAIHVILENHGERPLTIDSATLADSAGTPYAAGSDPWALEKQSKKLEKQYRDHGDAFMRAAGPGVLIVGVGFKRRRLPLPLTLAPGETRTGSLFYPMVRPGSLALYWSNDSGSETAVLPLEFLQALHVPPAPAVHASKQFSL